MFTELVGRPQVLATRRYPQAIAVALALRHRWRREELVKFAKHFGVKLTTKDLSDTSNTDTSDASAPDANAAGASRHQLQQKQVAFTERNIATDDAALNDLQKLGWMTTP